MNIQALALAFLAATAIGGLAWVFIYPLLSGEKKAENRRASVAKAEPAARQVDKGQRSRREQVEGSLKELEQRRLKESKVTLSARLTQAGLDWSTQKFLFISAILGAMAFALALVPMLGRGTETRTAPVIVDPQSTARTFELGLGNSLVIDLRRDFKDARTDNGQIASVSVRSRQQIYVSGVNEGRATIVVSGEGGVKIATIDVFVTRGSIVGTLLAAIGLGFAAGFGLPRWALSFLKKRREKNFLKALPDAVDAVSYTHLTLPTNREV